MASYKVPTGGGVPNPRNGFEGALEGIAGITGIVAPSATTSEIITVATLASTLAGALPGLLLVSEWRNAHGLALHAPYA